MSEYMNEIMSEIVEKINRQKEDLILKRINERVSLFEPFDIVKESQRRFPRIKIERKADMSEHYYWNDGTKDGIHLVSFYQDNNIPPFNELANGQMVFTTGIKYI